MPNPSSYFLGSSIVQKPAPASSPSVTSPIFAGITSKLANTDGSISVSYAAATTVNPPIEYVIYAALGSVTAGSLFNSANIVEIIPSGILTARIFTLKDQVTYLIKDQIYTFGVRSKDAYGNTDNNTAILTETSLGIDAEPSYEPRAVWSINASNQLCGSLWVTQDNELFSASLGTASYTIYDKNGASIGISESGLTADANGLFKTTPVLASALIDLTHYTVIFTIIAGGAARKGAVGITVAE